MVGKILEFHIRQPLAMAQNLDVYNSAEGNGGIKVKGDLADFQIIEEASESDDSDEETNKDNINKVGTLAALPPDLISPYSKPVFGSVQVTDSENVQFGNNTYFNGPVTIKQVITNTLGVDNACYTKTEEEALSAQQFKNEPKNDVSGMLCKLNKRI